MTRDPTGLVRSLGALVSAGTLCATSAACGGNPTGTRLTLVSLPAWDGGADAGCTIATLGERVGCATAYPITGDPRECQGFDSSGSGSTATCQSICKSGLTCDLSGVSDGTNAVACQATCASPEH